MRTRCPSPARPRAVSNPIPRLPPVTRAMRSMARVYGVAEPPRRPRRRQNEMKTMRAAVAREAGAPDSLTLDRLPVPELPPQRVLIAVRAASINPVDYKMMSGAMGTPFPLVPGRDLAGIVTEVAEGVEEFAEGDLVFGAAAWGPAGSFAEYTVAEPGTIAKVPDGLAIEQAAALPTIVNTAHTALFDVGKIGHGTRVLIAGASGGVGGIAVQLAKQAGAHVVG
ncbi:NADP-dependent oxidoreductase, partial [bacterium]